MEMLSNIQRLILENLMRFKVSARYSEAQPEGISNDLFYYHLSQLLGHGYIEKDQDGLYKLTDRGVKVLTNIKTEGHYRDDFKVSVMIYVTRKQEKEKQVMMARRLRHPYYDDLLPITGKMYHKHTFLSRADEKLFNEAGIKAKLRPVGIYRGKVFNSDESILIEDSIFFVLVGEYLSGDLLAEGKKGRNFWLGFDEAIKCESKNRTHSPAFVEILERIKDDRLSDFFILEDKIILT